jgi:hypothetical protein
MDTNKWSRVFQYGVKIFILAYATYLAVIHQLKGVLERQPMPMPTARSADSNRSTN